MIYDRCECCQMPLILGSRRLCQACMKAYELGRAEASELWADDGK